MASTRVLAATLVAVAITFAPTPARADGFFIPFFGVNFGGDAGTQFTQAFDTSQFTFGASLGYMGGGVFGFESDFGYSPDFYGKTDTGGSRLFTGTGNLIVGVPFGGQQGFGVRPYALIGAGVITSGADFGGGAIDLGDTNLAWSAGGGVMLFLGSAVGLRGDVRYFRSFDDLEILGVPIAQSSGKVDFTRGSLGLVLRF
jgi:hypothetical protein